VTSSVLRLGTGALLVASVTSSVSDVPALFLDSVF